MSLDFITALPPSAGNIIILTTVDHFSKQPILSPKVPSALEMAQLMTDDGLQLHRARLWLSLCLAGEERVKVSVWYHLFNTISAGVGNSGGRHKQPCSGQKSRINNVRIAVGHLNRVTHLVKRFGFPASVLGTD